MSFFHSGYGGGRLRPALIYNAFHEKKSDETTGETQWFKCQKCLLKQQRRKQVKKYFDGFAGAVTVVCIHRLEKFPNKAYEVGNKPSSSIDVTISTSP